VDFAAKRDGGELRAIGPKDLLDAGGLHPVREGIWMLAVPVPRAQPKYSICYIVTDEQSALHVIDPGLDLPAHRTLLENALEEIGGLSSVASITATHLHFDHLGLASWLRERSGAPIQLHERDARALTLHDAEEQRRLNEAWGVPRERRAELEEAYRDAHPPTDLCADRALADGDVVTIPGRRLRVLATPGHTSGHMCLVDDDLQLAFVGDLVLPVINPGFGLGAAGDGNPLADLLHSLTRVSDLDDYEACPGHGHRFSGLRGRSREIAAHHLSQNSLVAEAMQETPDATLWDLAQRLPRRRPLSEMTGGYLRSVLLQTSMHADFVREGGRDAT